MNGEVDQHASRNRQEAEECPPDDGPELLRLAPSPSDEEEHEGDEHIWLSLKNAGKLVQAIAQALGKIDPDYQTRYQANANAYIVRLQDLDQQYRRAVDEAKCKTILFGDRFPFRYLAEDYGLTYYAAFSGCSAESEASFQTIAFLAGKVDELGLTAVLTIENPKTELALQAFGELCFF